MGNFRSGYIKLDGYLNTQKLKVTGRVIVMAGVLLFLLLVSVSDTFAADYTGSGQFPAGGWIRWKFTGTSSGYEPRANISMGRWHTYTDANLLKVTSNEDIKVVVTSFGITTWYGFAYICDIYGNCDNSTAFSNTYKSCELDFNTYFSGSWSDAEKENTFMHEAGHCLSLAHRDGVNSIMDPDHSSQNWLNEYDKVLVNNRY
ncbi:MAG: hypothetical protein BroJett015_14440 [Chloroflexota bacterium]|nr:hypothetical protein [Chloroflexota bacterium]GIK55781.1 MAG: hypothetical protein BroJett015_14440 [Chloroflexota bacterium]